jgi:hypothetical protein
MTRCQLVTACATAFVAGGLASGIGVWWLSDSARQQAVAERIAAENRLRQAQAGAKFLRDAQFVPKEAANQSADVGSADQRVALLQRANKLEIWLGPLKGSAPVRVVTDPQQLQTIRSHIKAGMTDVLKMIYLVDLRFYQDDVLLGEVQMARNFGQWAFRGDRSPVGNSKELVGGQASIDG